MQYRESARPWTDIVAYRQRDRLIILPFTLLAAVAGAAWVGATFSAIWFVANVAIMGCSKLLCDWIDRLPSPGRRHEALLAGFTFAMTLIYAVLPVRIGLVGGEAGTIAGMALIGGMALSSVSEFAISRLVGGAALGATLLAGLLALVAKAPTGGPLQTGLAVIAILSFFAYVVQAAIHREKGEAETRAALAAARHAEAVAERANAAKSAFLATMSHEIRTPLNGVLGMAQALEADEMSPVQRERVAVIRQSGQTLTAILNDILDLAKIEAGQLDLEDIEFDLGEVVDSGRGAFAALAASKGLDLRVQIDPAAAGFYLGDPTRLRQVLYNLMSNAVKFTTEGSVEVRARPRGEALVLSVADTGAGIAAEQLERLFEKFVQLDASTTRRHGGTGLGLAICRDLCALMGGEIRVESRVGVGTTFTVVLPLRRVGERPGPTAAPAAREEPVFGGEVRLLAAEDNAVNQLVLRTLLSQVNIDPAIVDNGALAVAAWESGDWHAILMDVQMPVMDGLAAVREIRAREAATGRPRTPVIALTANAMVHQIAELRAAGMDAHVGKPIDVGQLFAALEAVLEPAAEDGREDTPTTRRVAEG